MQTVVVFVLYKRAFSNSEVKFLKSCLGDNFPKAFVGILLNELDGLFETNSCKQVAGVSKTLLVVHHKHFLDVLYLFWVLKHII